MDDDRFTMFPEENRCDVCGASFMTSGRLERHIRREHNDKREGAYACNICDETFNTPKQLNRHIHNRHGGLSDAR